MTFARSAFWRATSRIAAAASAAPKEPASHPQERHAHFAHRGETRAARARGPLAAVHASSATPGPRAARQRRAAPPRRLGGCSSSVFVKHESLVSSSVDVAGVMTRRTVRDASLRYTLALAETCAAATTRARPRRRHARRHEPGIHAPDVRVHDVVRVRGVLERQTQLAPPPRSSRIRSSSSPAPGKGAGTKAGRPRAKARARRRSRTGARRRLSLRASARHARARLRAARRRRAASGRGSRPARRRRRTSRRRRERALAETARRRRADHRQVFVAHADAHAARRGTGWVVGDAQARAPRRRPSTASARPEPRVAGPRDAHGRVLDLRARSLRARDAPSRRRRRRTACRSARARGTRRACARWCAGQPRARRVYGEELHDSGHDSGHDSVHDSVHDASRRAPRRKPPAGRTAAPTGRRGNALVSFGFGFGPPRGTVLSALAAKRRVFSPPTPPNARAPRSTAETAGRRGTPEPPRPIGAKNSW